jgi:hypothetical protein
MGCCGQARAAYTPAFEPPRPVRQDVLPADANGATPAADGAPLAGTVRLQFTRQSGVRVRGPVSGASYAFSGDAAVQAVDARDADALLRTGYFRRAY